ncbi:hypothetical protein VTO42DRAFT_6110 [Malbranchea cinnamomea]
MSAAISSQICYTVSEQYKTSTPCTLADMTSYQLWFMCRRRLHAGKRPEDLEREPPNGLCRKSTRLSERYQVCKQTRSSAADKVWHDTHHIPAI